MDLTLGCWAGAFQNTSLTAQTHTAGESLCVRESLCSCVVAEELLQQSCWAGRLHDVCLSVPIIVLCVESRPCLPSSHSAHAACVVVCLHLCECASVVKRRTLEEEAPISRFCNTDHGQGPLSSSFPVSCIPYKFSCSF